MIYSLFRMDQRDGKFFFDELTIQKQDFSGHIGKLKWPVLSEVVFPTQIIFRLELSTLRPRIKISWSVAQCVIILFLHLTT